MANTIDTQMQQYTPIIHGTITGAIGRQGSSKEYKDSCAKVAEASMRIRRLTPTECARLQGFPDDWHKLEGISDSQAYRCYGNAVTVDIVEMIARRLKND